VPRRKLGLLFVEIPSPLLHKEQPLGMAVKETCVTEPAVPLIFGNGSTPVAAN